MTSLTQEFGDARDFWAMADPTEPALTWLGQAGFAIRWRELRLLIDPYLSDSLAKKYQGTTRSHDRMMPSPIAAEELHGLDYVLCTHRHSDHMDPETLPALTSLYPANRFIVPRAEMETALKLGIPRRQLIFMSAKDSFILAKDARVVVLPASHETLETDEAGRNRYLGYVFNLGGYVIYHSGDTINYPGLAELLADQHIDLALLPVNGRGKGVPGNFTFEEAVKLCQDTAIPYLVPHHFGMFSFNTVDRSELARKNATVQTPECFLPEYGRWFQLNK